MLGDDAARTVLNHQKQNDALVRRYTRCINLLDLVGVHTGQARTAELESRLQTSSRASSRRRY